MSDLVRIGSTLYGWNSQSFKFSGVPYVGVQSIDYSEKRNRKLVRAAKRDGTPLGKTPGVYEPGELRFKMLADSAQLLLTFLAAQGLGSYGDAEITITVQVWEPALGPVTPILWMFTKACVIDVKDGSSEGPDELVTEIAFQPEMMLRNGVRMASLIRAVPL